MVPTCKVLCLVLLISASIVTSKEDVSKKEKQEERKNAKLPPCAACNSLVKSFQAGMRRTARGKLEGGDTAWEEKNQVLICPFHIFMELSFFSIYPYKCFVSAR